MKRNILTPLSRDSLNFVIDQKYILINQVLWIYLISYFPNQWTI